MDPTSTTITKPVYIPKTSSVSDEWRAGFFSRLTFSWLYPLIRLGHSRQLKPSDVGDNLDRDNVERHFLDFRLNLREGSIGTFRSTVWKSFSRLEYYAVLCKATSDLSAYILPFCVNQIVSYAGDPSGWGIEIWWVAFAMFVSVLVSSVCNHWFYQFVMIDGLHARCALQTAVYNKLLRTDNRRNNLDIVANLQSTDCRAIQSVYDMWMYSWAAPVQLIVTSSLLYYQLGWSSLVGIGLLLTLGPIQKYTLASLETDNKIVSGASDRRIAYVTKLLRGITVVKLQAWEDVFLARVETERSTELKHRRAVSFLNALNTAGTECAPIICTVATFAVYGSVEPEGLTATKVFTALSLFNLLRMPVFILPIIIRVFANGNVASERLGKFLYAEDLESYVEREDGGVGEDRVLLPSVEVKDSVFVWG